MRGKTIGWSGACLLTMMAVGCRDGAPGSLSSVVGPSTSPGTQNSSTFSSRCVVPPMPTGVAAAVEGTVVRVRWTPVVAATDYVVVAGANPGGVQTLLQNTPQASYQWVQAPAGTHYTRVYAHNGCGTSDPSQEVVVTVDE